MNRSPTWLLIALPLALAGCGNKGPLVLPEGAPVEAEVRATDGGVPVEIAPPQATPAPAPQGALPDLTSANPLLDPLEPSAEQGGFDPYAPPIDLDTLPEPVPQDDRAADGDG